MSRGRVAPWHPLRSFLCHQFVTKLRKRCERAVEHQSGDRGISVIDHSAIDHTTAHTTPTGTHHKAHNTPGIHQTCTTPGTQHKAHQAHTPRETHQACTTPDTQHKAQPAHTTRHTRHTHHERHTRHAPHQTHNTRHTRHTHHERDTRHTHHERHTRHTTQGTPGTRYTHATARPGTATANNQNMLSV